MARIFAGDIVFLIDATGSMEPAIDALKYNIDRFFQYFLLEFQEYGGNVDWRARVIGYRDVEEDGDDWYVSNPFVRDVAAVKGQLDALRAIGGGDQPESLLDALYKVARFGNTERGFPEENAGMWRHRRDAARCVIVFTDAPFHATTKLPEASGLSWEDIALFVMQEQLCLFIIAPQMDCYENLEESDRFCFFPSPGDSARSHDAFSCFLENVEIFRELAHCVSRTIWEERFHIPDPNPL